MYDKIVGVPTAHFAPGESVILSRHRFHTCSREANEAVSAFLSRLRHLARPCEFTRCAGILDGMLRDRFVSGIRDERLQSRLLSEKRLTLSSATAIATAHEAATSQAGEIAKSQAGPSGESDVHRVAMARGGQQRSAGCLRRPEVDGPFRAADAWGGTTRRRSVRFARVCFSCGKIGHTRAACKANRRDIGQVQSATRSIW